MDKKELQTYRGKSPVELHKEVREVRMRLNNLRFDLASGKVKNLKEIRDCKIKIARLCTIEKEQKNNSK